MFHWGRITRWQKVRSCLLSASEKSSYKAEITADCQGATFHRLDSVWHWVTLQTDPTTIPQSYGHTAPSQPPKSSSAKLLILSVTGKIQIQSTLLSLLWGTKAGNHCPQKSLGSNAPDFAKSRVSLLPAKPWLACSSTFSSTWLIPSFFTLALKWEGWQCCTACRALGKSSHTGNLVKGLTPALFSFQYSCAMEY